MNAPRGPVVPEAIVRLLAGGESLFEWRCTPAAVRALAVGRLYIEELIADAAIAAALVIEHHDEDIIIRLPALPALPARSGSPRARGTEPLPGPDEFAQLFRGLFAAVDERHESGGMHAAALAAGGRIAFQAEDVGRHNAVDKAIGMALLAGADPAAHGMLISSRISGEIARKAALGAVSWLASRSIPTTLAVRTAQATGLPLIGRAAGKHAYVYTGAPTRE